MRRAIEEIAGLRHRGRHLEDRGRRRSRRRGDARRAGAQGRRAARASSASLLGPRRLATRRSTSGSARPRRRRGLHRLRDRPLDLVGRPEGLPRRLARRARTPPRRSPTTTCASSASTRSSERGRRSGARFVTRAPDGSRRIRREGVGRAPRRRRPALAAVLLLALAAVGLARPRAWRRTARGGGSRPAAHDGGRVVRVVDGDTIRVARRPAGGARALHRDRHAGGRQARHAGAVLLARAAAAGTGASSRAGRSVLALDRERRDRYGRLLAYVYRAGRRPVRQRASSSPRRYARTLTVRAQHAPTRPQFDRLAHQAQRARAAGCGARASALACLTA